MKLHVYSQRSWLLGLLGGLLICFKIPYIVNAWQSSPLDSIDWIFPILSMVMALIVIVTSEPAWKYRVKTAMVGAAFCAIGFLVFTFVGSTNAIAIVFAIGFWWCILWTLLGWRQAFTLIPSFAILLLGTPSSTYWLCFFLGLSTVQAWILKIVIAIICSVLTILIIRYRWCWCQMNTLFIIAMLGAVIILFQIKSVTRTYSPLLLGYETTTGDYISREPAPDDSFKRFFVTSDAHNYEYASSLHIYNLLSVTCGNDIHEIHPASHCLRSSGWQISSEQITEITIKGHRFGVTEVEASRGPNYILVWVWYSTPHLSTGNFLGFRRLWDAKDGWKTYQLSVYNNNDRELSRKALVDFIETIPWNDAPLEDTEEDD